MTFTGDNAMQHLLQNYREQIFELYGVTREEEKGYEKRWRDEQPALRTYIDGLTDARDLLKREKKKVQQELATLHASLAKQAAANKLDKASSEELGDKSVEVIDLQKKLVELNNRVLDIDFELEKVKPMLGALGRPDEKFIYETKLVVLQDTRRILMDEITALRSEIFRRENLARYESDRKRAEDLGWTDLAHLQEQLARTETKLDQAKQALYFPEVKGYKFSGGGSGIYWAAKELYIAEVSGRFSFSIEPVTKPDGVDTARLVVQLSGASGSTDWAEFKAQAANVAQQTVPTPRQSYSSMSDKPGAAWDTEAPGAACPIGGAPPSGGLSMEDTQGRVEAAGDVQGTHHSRGSSQGVTDGRAPASNVVTSIRLQEPAPHCNPSGVALESTSAAHRSSGGGGNDVTTAERRVSGSSSTADSAGGSPTAARSVGGTGDWPFSQRHGGVLPGQVPRAAVMKFINNISGKKEKLKQAIQRDPRHDSDGADTPDPILAGGKARGMVGLPTGTTFRPGMDVLKSGFGRMSTATRGMASTLASAGTTTYRGLRSGLEEALPAAATAMAPLSSRVTATVASAWQQSRPGPGSITAPTDGTRIPSEDGDVFATHLAGATGGQSLLNCSVDQAVGDLVGAWQVSALPHAGMEETNVAAVSDSYGEQAADGGDKVASMDGNAKEEEPLPEKWEGDAVGTSEGVLSRKEGGVGEGPPSEIDVARVSGASPAAIAAAAVPDPEPHVAHKGVYVTLLAESLEVVAEKGTKVPNVSVTELALQVEVLMSATYEYNTLMGWHASKALTFEILHLDRHAVGNNIPLPKALIRTIMNMVMPSVFNKQLLVALPQELGRYVVESRQALMVAGEFRIVGPALSTVSADVSLLPNSGTEAQRRIPAWQREVQGALRARALLGLTEQQAAALADLFSGKYGLLETPRPISVCELCRFYTLFSRNSTWQPLCNMWNRALQLAFEHYGTTERFSFLPFMENVVAPLTRKPVRVHFALEKLDLRVQADSAIAALHDYFERTAREFAKNIHNAGGVVPTEPLEVQLEAIHLWYQSVLVALRRFKAKFRSASATVLLSVDTNNFQFGAEHVHYEGPLQIKVPVPLLHGMARTLQYDIVLPEPGQAGAVGGTYLNKFKYVLDKLLESAYTSGKRASDVGPASALSKGAVLGSIVMKRLLLALRLDERRVAELMRSAAGCNNDPELLAHLLACFGNLFTATLAAPNQALDTKNESESSGLNDLPCTLTITNNDVTRVRGELDSVMFQSGMAPSSAISLLHSVLVAVAHQFLPDSEHYVLFLGKVFQQLHEYLSKDALDILLCLSARADVKEDMLYLVFGGERFSTNGAGDVGNAVWPAYLVNDVNLLTVMDSFKLLVEG